MLDPNTLTATAVVTLVFKKFIESSSSELSKKITISTINKIKFLRQKIWEKISKHSDVAEIRNELDSNKQATEKQINRISNYLKTEFSRDPNFSLEVKKLASEIHQDLYLEQSQNKNVQNISGGRAFQVNSPEAPVIQGVSGGTININIDQSSDY